jgi:hypothetical protein
MYCPAGPADPDPEGAELGRLLGGDHVRVLVEHEEVEQEESGDQGQEADPQPGGDVEVTARDLTRGFGEQRGQRHRSNLGGA